MKIVKLKSIILCLALTVMSSVSLAAEVISTNESYTLSNGTEVNMPFVLGESKTAIIAGLSKKSTMYQSLDNFELKPISIPCQSNLGVTAVFAQNIGQSNTGAYNELVNTFFVQKKDAPDLALPCLSDTKQESVINFILTTLNAIALANQDNLAAGMPLDYGMYTDSLLVTTDDAKLAGIEIWGFPKEKTDIKFEVNSQQFNVTANNLSGTTPIVSFKMYRDTATIPKLDAFGLNGDFFVPRSLSPNDRMPQLNGVLVNSEGTGAWIYPYVGSLEVDDLYSFFNSFAKYLKKSDFKPAVVFEFEKAKAVFYSNRQY